ncbi:MAG TPA: hypothetical protein DEP84_31780, partial [Chloroflexi bacterium]|nr:hypothetical protein [Chloroflexota bacterium]
MNKAHTLTQGRIFRFWAPLAAVWLILAAEQPSAAAVIARLPDATTHLAAFGLSFSLVLIVESPVTMLLTATTALATHQQAYRRLLLFAHILVLVTTVAHLLLGLTPAYPFVLRRWIGVPENVIGPAQTVFLLMLPWTAMVAYRRFYEGILIHYGHPKRVSAAQLVRLVTALFVLVSGLGLARWSGAAVA